MLRLRHALLIAATGLGGCAQVFGIDETTSGGSNDGGGPATLEVQRTSIGVSASRAKLDITGLIASYLTPARVAATITATDTWSANVVGAPPIEFQLPDSPVPIPRIYAFGQRNLLGDLELLEDPGFMPAPTTATFAINVALNSPYAGESLQMMTIGAWSQYVFPAADLPAMGATNFMPAAAVPYASFANLGEGELHQITNADAVLVLRYTGGQLVGALDVTSFNQATGSNPIAGTMAAVTADQMGSAAIMPALVPARYNALTPAFGTPQQSWAISATPGVSISTTAGPQLAGAAVLQTATTVGGSFGNPFTSRGWTPVLAYNTSASRTYTPTGMTSPITLSAGISQADLATTTAPFDLAVGMPTMITVAEMPLTTDGMMVTIDATQPVQVAFTTDQAVNTLYKVTLAELVASTDGTSAVETTRLVAYGLEPSFAVPADYFISGHSYVIRANAVVGSAPAIASGNFQDRTLPIATAFSDSAVFTVQ